VNIRVSILFRNRLLKDSIARILTKRADFELIAALPCNSRSSVVADCGDHTPEVLLLDSLEHLPDSACAARNGSSGPPRRPLLLAMDDDPAQFLRAVQRGALGYVLQDASAADVLAAIRNVAEGQAVCPPQFTRLLFDYIAAQADSMPSARRRERWVLTRREQQLIPLIERGLSNKEIADFFHLSEQTVKNHVHRILRKTGASGRLSIGEACRDSVSLINAASGVRPKLDSSRALF
jgi:DNA-binding NarL/FixJ family response regulator